MDEDSRRPLILLGLTLLSSPEIEYTTREKIFHTRYSVKREKTIVIPTAASAVFIGAGVILVILASRTPHQ